MKGSGPDRARERVRVLCWVQGVGEIPGDAVLDFDVELLSIKQDAIGYRTKLVEG